VNRSLTGRPPVALHKEKPIAARLSLLTATQLHERYLDAVFGYVSRRVPGRAEAEDVTAEVFAAAFIGLTRFHGDAPLAWLLGIARRKVADSLRRSGNRKETLASELTGGAAIVDRLIPQETGLKSSPEQIAQQQEAHRHIRALVDSLRPDQREALLLQYVEELSIAEIGVVMGRSPQAVNSLLQRARANIFRAGHGYFLSDPFPMSSASDRSQL
jgi:RNA polymerase sigma-70 factor (ECF subfamily)